MFCPPFFFALCSLFSPGIDLAVCSGKRPPPQQQAGSREQREHGELHNGGHVKYTPQRKGDGEQQNESCYQKSDTQDVTDLLVGSSEDRQG